VASGHGRGGRRRWRDWLHRATHHSADDDRQLVQADEQSRREGEDRPGGGAKTQASLDQVLRRAAAERAARGGTKA
jgi:hypothetical protein